MKRINQSSDITVVGGGLAGVCAAIAAARQGATVSLVQNRPVLGGNSSSEVRVWVCGATAHGVQQWARETGIIGELFVENQYRNPEGNPYYWDLTVLEAVRAEPNITLFLNTDVQHVEVDGPAERRTIKAVTGWQQGSELVIRFESSVFLDCTGDGLIGYLAGADFMTGREAYSAFGESWAPQVPDNNTLGSTILFYSKDLGQPSKFVPPAFAVDIEAAGIPEHRLIRSRMSGCDFWWVEWGGELDIVDDNERIRDELQAVVYGIWNYIKNSGKFDDVDDLTLEWIGAVPGKREYRRFLGDHVLTQHDVLGQTRFKDAIGFGGWSIDLHPPGGVYATTAGSRHWYPDGTYDIPLRSLYSRNVANLWVAGRNISATHVAFGSARVMATCAVLGEAAGLGAAVALQAGMTPRELANTGFDLMKQALVRSDASVVGLLNDDPDDLAHSAIVQVSSTRTVISNDPSGGVQPLDRDLGIIIPVGGSLRRLELLADVSEASSLKVEFFRSNNPRNYLPDRFVAAVDVPVTPGDKQWLLIDPVDAGQDEDPSDGNIFMVVRSHQGIRLWSSNDWIPGVAFLHRREPGIGEEWDEQFREWRASDPHEGVVFRVVDPVPTLGAERLVGGYARPYGGPQLWSSTALDTDQAPTVQLNWEAHVTLSEVQLVLDDDVATDLINLHHHRTDHEIMPTLIRDYDLEIRTVDGWQVLEQVRDNRRRHRRHRFPMPITCDSLRVRLLATHGHDHAHIVKIRAYR